jgi:C4-dicarboxylate transporter DctM subunit
MEGILTFLLFFILIFLTLPIPITFITAAIIAFTLWGGDIPLITIAQQMAFSLRNYAFAAILFFVFAGNLMVKGRLSTIVINLANVFLRTIPGGLAITSVAACGLFGAISGSSTAALAAIGTIMVPALNDQKYNDNFSVALLASAGILAMVIPPSIPVIIYCVATGVSVGGLFLSGVLPGIIIMLFFGIYLSRDAKKKGLIGEYKRPSIKEMLIAIKESFWVLSLIVIIFGGIYSGICSVTESAAAGATWALIVELVIFRHIKVKDVPKIAIESAVVTSVVLLILCTAMVFSQYLTLEQLPNKAASFIQSISKDKWVFLVLTNILLLIVGCLIDSASAIMILAPLFLPMYKLYGMDDLHFGMIFLLNLYVGYITPPVGYSLFAAVGIFRVRLLDVARFAIPFAIMMLIVLILVIIFPFLSTWVPSLIMPTSR